MSILERFSKRFPRTNKNSLRRAIDKVKLTFDPAKTKLEELQHQKLDSELGKSDTEATDRPDFLSKNLDQLAGHQKGEYEYSKKLFDNIAAAVKIAKILDSKNIDNSERIAARIVLSMDLYAVTAAASEKIFPIIAVGGKGATANPNSEYEEDYFVVLKDFPIDMPKPYRFTKGMIFWGKLQVHGDFVESGMDRIPKANVRKATHEEIAHLQGTLERRKKRWGYNSNTKKWATANPTSRGGYAVTATASDGSLLGISIMPFDNISEARNFIRYYPSMVSPEIFPISEIDKHSIEYFKIDKSNNDLLNFYFPSKLDSKNIDNSERIAARIVLSMDLYDMARDIEHRYPDINIVIDETGELEKEKAIHLYNPTEQALEDAAEDASNKGFDTIVISVEPSWAVGAKKKRKAQYGNPQLRQPFNRIHDQSKDLESSWLKHPGQPKTDKDVTMAPYNTPQGVDYVNAKYSRSPYSSSYWAEKMVVALSHREYLSAQEAYDGFKNHEYARYMGSVQKSEIIDILKSWGFAVNDKEVDKDLKVK